MYNVDPKNFVYNCGENGLYNMYTTVRNDAYTAYTSPWFTITADSNVLTVVVNAICPFDSDDMSDPTSNLTYDARATCIYDTFDGGVGQIEAVVSNATVTDNIPTFYVNFAGDSMASKGVVASPVQGVVDSYSVPEQIGTVASVSTDTVRFTVLSDVSSVSGGDLHFFATGDQPDQGVTAEVDSIDSTTGAVTYTTDVSAIAIPTYGIWFGTYTVTLDTAGDSSNFAEDDAVYFTSDDFLTTFDTSYNVLSTDTGTVTFTNLPTSSIVGQNMLVGENRVYLTDSDDTGNFSTDQKISFMTSDVYGVPDDTTTATVESVGSNYIVVDAIPSEFAIGDYIFSGAVLWAYIKVTVSSRSYIP